MTQSKLTLASLFVLVWLLLGLASIQAGSELRELLTHPPYPTPIVKFTWIKLGDAWTLTWYGSEADGFLGLRHGAAWNGLACKDWTRLPAIMPGAVTATHLGVAMPGIEFYCMPVKVCVAARCVIATAVDVPHDMVIGGKPHVDVWQAVARELGCKRPE